MGNTFVWCTFIPVVWQASRIFGIPYSSLLMYVRGKYGKSLKLDVLKKGLDHAMENSNIAAAADDLKSGNKMNGTTVSPISEPTPIISTPPPQKVGESISQIPTLFQSLYQSNNKVSETNNANNNLTSNHTPHLSHHHHSKHATPSVQNNNRKGHNLGSQFPHAQDPRAIIQGRFNPFLFGDFGILSQLRSNTSYPPILTGHHHLQRVNRHSGYARSNQHHQMRQNGGTVLLEGGVD